MTDDSNDAERALRALYFRKVAEKRRFREALVQIRRTRLQNSSELRDTLRVLTDLHNTWCSVPEFCEEVLE